MLRRLLVLALVALATVLPVGSASAAPYTPKIPTQTIVKIVVGADHSVTVIVRVLANTGNGHPHGVVKLDIGVFTPTARGARAVAPATWHDSVRYNGGRVRLQGPTLSPGTYIANAAYHPAGNTYRPSRTAKRFHIGATPADHNPGDNNDSGGGLLPDTGGPYLLWLLLGGGLVGAGAGAVVYSRRRRAQRSTVAV